MHRGDLADLTAFIAIANNLSFRPAALRLGVTPSALTHSMRQLEERLRTDLPSDCIRVLGQRVAQ